MRMFMTRPDEYVGLLRKPPFKWSSMFRPVDDPVVERRRKQYVLAGLAAIGYLFVSFLGVILYAALFVW
jgi:hypothetical protein